ncbi:MAG: type III-A CRISPR-associated protein Csm2 [Lachnospiraceae bacterium]|nr:type III-A CRISPR-associated protein Csm2 [Lachnospiraceae bacterium]
MAINESTYVDQAESVIKKLSANKDNRGNPKWITTSKIRNLLAMTADIYNEVLGMSEELPEEVCSRIDYLRVRFVYECGRDPMLVKTFVEQAGLIEALKEINGSRKNFILFNRYLEALVAYHRFYGGKD